MTIKLLSVHRNDLNDLPYFYPTDTRELYQKSLSSQPLDWSWRSQSILYNLNSQGYRCAEFDSIDWSASILCLGCSMTFGIGVDTDQTWPAQLSEILAVPCVNLGQPGASSQFIWANSVKLLAAGVRPRAVVYYWPDYSRSFEFVETDGGLNTVNWGHWNKPVYYPGRVGHLASAWVANPLNARAFTELYMQSLTWSCPRLDLTWSAEPLGQQQHYLVKLDHARDLQHPGPLTWSQLALDIAGLLKI
jgi:hypothetical protein